MTEENDAKLQYLVKVDINRLTLSEKGTMCLAIECYCIKVKKAKKYTTFFFENKEHAQAFTNFLNQHVKPESFL